MDDFIPNFSASTQQDQQEMLVRWANRLTSNNLALMATIARLEERIAALEQQVAEHSARLDNQGG
jgi:uncharacterized protein YceH (UPF0502 family)